MSKREKTSKNERKKRAKQEWEKLTIANDFIFGKVMEDESICREMLERILDIKIKKITYPETQKTIDVTLEGRGIRLDVYAADENNTIYNVEMQTINRILGKRTRYYQGMIDLNMIEKGAKYNELENTYIIFFCTFDLFKRNRSKYTFHPYCEEEPDLILEDGSARIFLNTKSTRDDCNEKLKNLLVYVDGKSDNPEFDMKMNEQIHNDSFILQLDQKVQEIKNSKKWRREYMTLYMRDQENRDMGYEEGVEQGIYNMVATLKRFQVATDIIVEELVNNYELTKEEAMKYC